MADPKAPLAMANETGHTSDMNGVVSGAGARGRGWTAESDENSVTL